MRIRIGIRNIIYYVVHLATGLTSKEWSCRGRADLRPHGVLPRVGSPMKHDLLAQPA